MAEYICTYCYNLVKGIMSGLHVILVLNSDSGIGRAVAQQHLDRKNVVIGISEAVPQVTGDTYFHILGSSSNSWVAKELDDLLKKLAITKIDFVFWAFKPTSEHQRVCFKRDLGMLAWDNKNVASPLDISITSEFNYLPVNYADEVD